MSSDPESLQDARDEEPGSCGTEINAGQHDGQPFEQGQTYELRGTSETYRVGWFYRTINKGAGRMQAKGYVRTRTAVPNSESSRLCMPEDKTVFGPAVVSTLTTTA